MYFPVLTFSFVRRPLATMQPFPLAWLGSHRRRPTLERNVAPEVVARGVLFWLFFFVPHPSPLSVGHQEWDPTPTPTTVCRPSFSGRVGDRGPVAARPATPPAAGLRRSGPPPLPPAGVAPAPASTSSQAAGPNVVRFGPNTLQGHVGYSDTFQRQFGHNHTLQDTLVTGPSLANSELKPTLLLGTGVSEAAIVRRRQGCPSAQGEAWSHALAALLQATLEGQAAAGAIPVAGPAMSPRPASRALLRLAGVSLGLQRATCHAFPRNWISPFSTDWVVGTGFCLSPQT